MIRIHKRSFESIEKMHRVNRRKFGIHWRSSEPRRNSSQPDCEPLHAYTRHSSYLTFLPRPGSDKWMKEVTGIIIVRRSVNGVERKKNIYSHIFVTTDSTLEAVTKFYCSCSSKLCLQHTFESHLHFNLTRCSDIYIYFYPNSDPKGLHWSSSNPGQKPKKGESKKRKTKTEGRQA